MTIGSTTLLTTPTVDTKNMNAIDISILKKSLNTAETSAAMLTQMMESSVTPHLGANIDIRL